MSDLDLLAVEAKTNTDLMNNLIIQYENFILKLPHLLPEAIFQVMMSGQ